MKVTVSELQLSTPYQGTDVPDAARLFALKGFTNSDGEIIVGGNPDTSQFYKEVPVAVSHGIVTIGAFTDDNKVDSTVNGGIDGGGLYLLALYSAGRLIQILYSKLQVPDTNETTTWNDIDEFTRSPQTRSGQVRHPSWEYVQTLFGSIISGMQKATTVAWGALRLRTIADDVSDPIGVGDNDTRLVKNLADYEDSLSLAVSEIGSDEMILSVTRPVTVGTVTLPENITLDVGVSGLITVQSGETLTVGSLRNPGNRKIFAGTGNVRFKEGAVDYANVAWFTGLPVSGSVDATYAINQINASFIANKGGVIFLPIGVWRFGGHILADTTIIKGAGNYPGYNFGTRLILTESDTFGFKIGEGEWGIRFQDLTIDGDNNENVDGIICTGTYPNTSGNLKTDNVSIINCTHGVRILSQSGSWQMAQMAFEQTTFYNNSHSGIRCNTSNATIKLDTCFFHIPVGGWAGDLENCGSLIAIGTEHAGMAGTLACSGGVPNAGMAEGGWRIGGFHAPLNFIGCSDEGLRYFIENNASDVEGIININGCVVGSDILLNETCKVNSEGNYFLGKAFRDSENSASRIISRNDRFRPIDSCGNVIDAGIPSAFVGGSVIIVEENADAEELRYRLPAKFYQNETFFALPDEDAWFGIYSTRPEKRLFGLGRCDAIGTPDFYYNFYRNENGELELEGNQTGFKGYVYDGRTRYKDTVSLTSSATITIEANKANTFSLIPGHNANINIQGMEAGQPIWLWVFTSGTTSRTLTFNTGFKANGTLVTGTADGKFFLIKFFAISDSLVLEESRTPAM